MGATVAKAVNVVRGRGAQDPDEAENAADETTGRGDMFSALRSSTAAAASQVAAAVRRTNERKVASDGNGDDTEQPARASSGEVPHEAASGASELNTSGASGSERSDARSPPVRRPAGGTSRLDLSSKLLANAQDAMARGDALSPRISRLPSPSQSERGQLHEESARLNPELSDEGGAGKRRVDIDEALRGRDDLAGPQRFLISVVEAQRVLAADGTVVVRVMYGCPP